MPNIDRESSADKNIGDSRQFDGSEIIRTYTSLQLYFLFRYEKLFHLREDFTNRLSQTHWRRRLIDKALYSTYLDCEQLGVGDVVKEYLERKEK